jgi:hypothetical protein
MLEYRCTIRLQLLLHTLQQNFQELYMRIVYAHPKRLKNFQNALNENALSNSFLPEKNIGAVLNLYPTPVFLLFTTFSYLCAFQ